jgi:RHS repeat-associated protein
VIDYTYTQDSLKTFYRGQKRYELSNHLGNVLSVITDRRIQACGAGDVMHYEAQVVSVSDYYPFGMRIKEREWSDSSFGYRFGFNGKEKDNEIKGDGNSINYLARIYDPRLGKFLSVDPLTKKYPELTPYQFASNTPIVGVDQDGEEVRLYTESPNYLKLNVGHTFITVGNGKDVVIYTYGRYGQVDAPSGGNSGHSLNSLSSTGEGVLRRLAGAEAQKFLKDAFKNEKVNAYEIGDADETKTAAFFENQIDNPNSKTPTVGPQAGKIDACVVDQYDLGNNNCTTKSIEAINAGGSNAFKQTTQEVKTTQMVRRGGEPDFILKGTGKFSTTPLQSGQVPWSPGGTKQFMDYQQQAPQNKVTEVTEQVKPK